MIRLPCVDIPPQTLDFGGQKATQSVAFAQGLASVWATGFSADRVPADRRFSLPHLSLVARRSSPRTAHACPGGLVCAVPVPIGNAFPTNGWSCACGFGARCLLPLWILRFFLRTDQSGRLPKNNSLWASKAGNSGHMESVTCDLRRRGVFGQPVPRALHPRATSQNGTMAE